MNGLFILTISGLGFQNDRHNDKGKSMNYHPRISVSIAVFIACCILFFAGCTRPKGGPQGHPGGPGGIFLSTTFDGRPFNMAVDKLAPGYTGHNLQLLYNNIQMRKHMAAKDSRETEEQYRARIDREISLPLMGAMDFDSIYAFRISPEEVLYDRKDQAMRVRCPLSAAFEAGREDGMKRAFMVRYLPQLDNRYTITKSDGSRVNIEEIKFSEYAVVVVNTGALPIETTAKANAGDDRKPHSGNKGSGREAIAAVTKMTPEEAGRIEGGIMALLVGRLAAPYTSYEEISHRPAAENPGTYLGRYHYVYINLIEIWFYDARSGKVLKKMPPS